MSILIYLYYSSIVYAQSCDTTKATIFLNQGIENRSLMDTTNLKYICIFGEL